MGLDYSLSSIRLPECRARRSNCRRGSSVSCSRSCGVSRIASRVSRVGVVVEAADVRPNLRQEGFTCLHEGRHCRRPARSNGTVDRRCAEFQSRSMQDVAKQAVREYVESHSRQDLLRTVLDEELPRYAEALDGLGK